MTDRDQASIFLDKSGVKAADLDHRRKINCNIGKYNAVVPWVKTI
jgi:L-lactate dehydrogenase complex protein LldF